MITVLGYTKTNPKLPETISVITEYTENQITLRIPKEQINGHAYEKLSVMCELTQVDASNSGYLFYPTHFGPGVVLSYLTPRNDMCYDSNLATMPVCGIGGCPEAVMIHVESGYEDLFFHIEVKNNQYSITPQFMLDGDDVTDDIKIVFYPMPHATYSDMAAKYRTYQLNHGCIPLKERAKNRPELAYAAESMEFRVRMGWKPVPTPYMIQTPENEPELLVACDLNKLETLVSEMHRNGIKKAQICLVGWSDGGHDGKFPQNYPSDSRYGGDEKLKDFIAKAQALGYQIVCHTNSVCAYPIADNWDESLLTYSRSKYGHIIPQVRQDYYLTGGLSGGMPFHLCAKTAYENYAVHDLPRIAEYGFRGLHFIDELTALAPEKCYHPQHSINRKEGMEYYRKIARLSKELFGGYQSEAWFDYMNADVDYVMYTSARFEVNNTTHPLFDEGIPFWQLVYHGIVLSNPNSHTTNYPIKGTKEFLKLLEYGGRPLMYLYSKFGDKKNWMGDIDLTCEDETDMKRTILALKKTYDDFEKLKHLQYEFMTEHRKLKNGVYQTVYSNGTTVTVDYNKEEYVIED